MLPESYQDLYEPQQPEGASFATIDQIFADGVTLRFDGMDAPTAKRYKCNAFVVFQPGDRVRVIKDSRTYVVEYPVGNPRTRMTADYAGSAGSANTASNASSADAATRATSAQHLFSDGVIGGTRIFLKYSGGRYYVGVSGGSYVQIATN